MDSSRTFDAGTSSHRGPSPRLCSPEPAVCAASLPFADSYCVDIMRSYRFRGGLAREIEVLLKLQHHQHRCESGSVYSPRSIRPIGFERAIRFSWGGWTWLPLFQFTMDDVTLREGPLRVADALGPELDGWNIANWFIARNAWLGDQQPIDLMEKELPLVIEAASRDRFPPVG